MRKIHMSDVEKLLGQEAVDKMLNEFAGGQLYIPKNGIRNIADRNRQIKEQYLSSDLFSYDDIAEKWNLSKERVRQIVNQR